MKENGLEEYRLAAEAGALTTDGKAKITVVTDGSWAKRSYRKNYDSLSGAAVIIGYRTKKLLFLGVRNRHCYHCAVAIQEDVDLIPPHRCFKNWSSSAGSMGADIICEGFANSITDHNLIYECMIGDGDSSCYNKILKLDPYRAYNLQVQKVECRNHLLRNYLTKISDLVSNTAAGPLNLRKIIDSNKLRLRAAVTRAIAFDGIIQADGIVELKCPYSARNMTPEEGITEGKITFWEKNTGLVNQKDKWYYQIQGQLQVTKKTRCVFGVWTLKGFKYEAIFRDEDFFKTRMLEPLTKFFYDALLPELVDPSNQRNFICQSKTKPHLGS